MKRKTVRWTIMIKGMGCPGGCVAGVGTIIPSETAKASVERYVNESAGGSCQRILAEKLTEME